MHSCAMRTEKIIAFAAFLLAAASLLGGCGGPKDLYSWYDYENRSFDWVKKRTPESEEKLLKTYARMLEVQRGTRKTPPPGMCAEYGYLLIKRGNTREGLELLKKEIALYPESAEFIGRIIKQIEE